MNRCEIPFNQLYIHSSGKVYPCSFLQNNPSYVLGDIRNQSLKEIWNSKSLEIFRNSHLSNMPSRCSENIKNFNCCNVGRRPYFSSALESNWDVKRLDIMLDSACNLTCNMCTNIYDETGGLRSNFFWQNNNDIFSSIKELELVGGEPLISPHFERLVQLISPINPNLDWRITTNAHYQITPKLLSLFKDINLRTLTISLDSLVPEHFEFIRQRSKFQTVHDNIFILAKHVDHININMVIQHINRDEVIDVYKWCRDNGFGFYPILLVYPDQHSLLKLSKEDQTHWFSNLIEANNSIQSKELFFLIKKSLNALELNHDKNILLQYLDHLKLMEAAFV